MLWWFANRKGTKWAYCVLKSLQGVLSVKLLIFCLAARLQCTASRNSEVKWGRPFVQPVLWASLWEIWLGILSRLFAGEPGAMDPLGFGGGCHRHRSCMIEEWGTYISFDQKEACFDLHCGNRSRIWRRCGKIRVGKRSSKYVGNLYQKVKGSQRNKYLQVSWTHLSSSLPFSAKTDLVETRYSIPIDFSRTRITALEILAKISPYYNYPSKTERNPGRILLIFLNSCFSEQDCV